MHDVRRVLERRPPQTTRVQPLGQALDGNDRSDPADQRHFLARRRVRGGAEVGRELGDLSPQDIVPQHHHKRNVERADTRHESVQATELVVVVACFRRIGVHLCGECT